MLGLAVFVAQQSLRDLSVHLNYAFLPGQREVVLGPVKQSAQVMQVSWTKMFYSKQVGNHYTTPGYRDEAVGSIEWSVKDGDLFGKPCIVIKMSGWTKQIMVYEKPQHVEVPHLCKAATTYWIRDGKILRQYEMRDDEFDGFRTATMTYGEDSILAFIENKGKRDQLNINVSDMASLHAQFKPMIVDGKVVVEKKDYTVYDPFAHGFEKRTATVSGAFNGQWGGEKYKGKAIDVDGQYTKLKAYVSEEGDLVKADLPNDRFYVLQNIPPARAKVKGG